MSIEHVVVLRCDTPGCDSTYTGEPEAFATVVRAAARKQGWIKRLGEPEPRYSRYNGGEPWGTVRHGFDACPVHADRKKPGPKPRQEAE